MDCFIGEKDDEAEEERKDCPPTAIDCDHEDPCLKPETLPLAKELVSSKLEPYYRDIRSH